MGTNQSAATPGGIKGIGAVPGAAANNWAGPTGPDYTTGTIDYYLVVGWSSNEGNNWLTVSNRLATGTMIAGASSWFGTSLVTFNYNGGGAGGQPTVSVWGDSTGLLNGGLASGFYLLPIPEPSTIVLAGLGGLSLLLFRRRK
jgi:hypothetical protein